MFKLLLSVFLFFVFLLSFFAASFLDNSRNYKIETEELLPVKINRSYLTIINYNTLIFAGDVMIGRSVQTQALNNGSVHYPFLKTREFLSSADITFVNLENPIISDCPIHNTGFIFCAKADFAKAIKEAGIDVVSLANNHTMNYGTKGLAETRKILDETGIRYTGVGEIEIIVSNGVKFGFLGFDKSQIPKPVLTQAEKELISEANIKVDVLIVSMHWGVEYQDYANSGQKDLAKEIVDLGADVIIGHHPHVVQDYEEIAGVPVFYSLGNFVFDQMWSEKTKKGKLVKIVFENTQIVGIKEYNTYIEKVGQPIIVSDATLN